MSFEEGHESAGPVSVPTSPTSSGRRPSGNPRTELIASENFVSEAVLEAVGSVLTNKYAEGYPGRRYYGGCGSSTGPKTSRSARARELFGAERQCQPHSGSQANMAVYFTLLKLAIRCWRRTWPTVAAPHREAAR